jgi:hypothetical protein
MFATKTLDRTIIWGKPSSTRNNRYRLIAFSGAIFFVTFASDIFFVTALAEDSPMLWIWGLAMMSCFAALIASLKYDGFKLSHYVVDKAGVHLQYEIADGPLATIKPFHRTQDWHEIKSAHYSTYTDEDGPETNVGVMLTLTRPIESGRTEIELKSEQPEELMSLIHPQIAIARSPERQLKSILVIA